MIVSEHLCGVAVAYDESRATPKTCPSCGKKIGHEKECVFYQPPSGRNQGSLINSQKRQVADACEWIRLNCVHRPRIFVATTSNKWGPDIYLPKISQFVHTLRNGYQVKNFVWVREFNSKGAPHYHFVVDSPKLKPVTMSLYWSSLFGATARNSIRLGTKPNPKTGIRDYFLKSREMGFYMSKYMGKDFDVYGPKLPGRKFGISQQAAQGSEPNKFEVKYYFQSQPGEVLSASGKMVPRPEICVGQISIDPKGNVFDKNDYKWKKCQEHQVWVGKKFSHLT